MYSVFESELEIKPDYGCHHGDNYSKYFNLVALARQTQLEQFYNLPLTEIHSRGYTLIISTVHINFIRDPQEGEKVVVKTQLDSFSGGACNVNFWVYKKGNRKLVADGYLVYTIKSTASDLSDQFPDDFVEKLSI